MITFLLGLTLGIIIGVTGLVLMRSQKQAKKTSEENERRKKQAIRGGGICGLYVKNHVKH